MAIEKKKPPSSEGNRERTAQGRKESTAAKGFGTSVPFTEISPSGRVKPRMAGEMADAVERCEDRLAQGLRTDDGREADGEPDTRMRSEKEGDSWGPQELENCLSTLRGDYCGYGSIEILRSLAHYGIDISEAIPLLEPRFEDMLSGGRLGKKRYDTPFIMSAAYFDDTLYSAAYLIAKHHMREGHPERVIWVLDKGDLVSARAVVDATLDLMVKGHDVSAYASAIYDIKAKPTPGERSDSPQARLAASLDNLAVSLASAPPEVANRFAKALREAAIAKAKKAGEVEPD